MSLTFSIVVNTYNRAASLENTLKSFDYLRYPDYEVIAVNGPSTDATEQLLQRYASRIKIGHCPEANLSVSRNIGIGMARGDVVCFIDDDGIPEPGWLDGLAAAYLANPRLGGVGGFVRDHTGVDYQCRYIVCNRYGDAVFHDHAENARIEEQAHTEQFYSLIGVNSSFRREALLEIGGFDEEYAYFLDETDVCVRLVDAGWKIKAIPGAEVHHKYAPSHLRNEKKLPTNLYFTTRSKVYFQYRNALPGTEANAVFAQAAKVKNQILWDVDHLRNLSLIDDPRHAQLRDDVRRGFCDGTRDAYAFPAGRPIPPEVLAADAQFLPFAPRLPFEARRQLILISQDYPPRNCGGIGVFMHRLAEALAEEGHEVSVITKSAGRHTVDLENGVWVHRIPQADHGARDYPRLPNLPRDIRNHAYTVYDEALRIQAQRGGSVTLSAIWDLEAAACVASQAFTNYVYLVTTYQLSVPTKPDWQNNAHYLEHHVNAMIAGERWLMASAQQLIASTHGIWEDIGRLNPDLQTRNPVPIIPFGLPSAPQCAPARSESPDAAINVLYVGRFELRKGVDLLFDAIPELLERHAQLHFRMVGDDTLLVGETTLKQRFLSRLGSQPKWLDRVHFLGFVDDETLSAEYAGCDVFVAPSRYESFGLIYLEAMRWGKPCIGSRAGGIPDVLTADCGFLPPPGDAAALGAAIETLVSQPGLRRDMGLAGKLRFERLYSMSAFTARLLDAIAKPGTP